jgi:type I restriction enzyme S subunit
LTEVQDLELLLKQGDLLFNWRNGSSEHLGKTVFFDLPGKWTHVSFLLRIRPQFENTSTAFLRFFLNGMRETGFFARSKAGVNNTFNLFELANLMVAAPPTRGEQEIIANTIQKIVAKLDDTSTEIVKSLDLLLEYRFALITAAVTGQIEGLR